jgi:Flp pilus assembly protein TadG
MEWLLKLTGVGRRRRRNAVQGAGFADLICCRSGGTAMEFALLAPAMLVLLIGTIEAGRMLWMLNALHYSVQEAARCASVNTTLCGTPTQIQTFAAGRSGAAFASSVFTATVAGCGNRVSASYPAHTFIPFVTQSITLTAQSCYPI